MSKPNPLNSENLVLVHKANSVWEGKMIVEYLRESGIEATMELPPSVSPLDVAEELSGSDRSDGIFVLQHDAERAHALVKEFVASRPTDET